jgi:hypothetical protein
MINNYKTRLILLFCALSACKKNSDPVVDTPAQLDASGTWSTSSISNNTNGFSVSSAQFPCLANNRLVLSPGGTASREYDGMDTCYMTKIPPYILGVPGDSTPGTWSQHGDSVTIQIQGLTKPGLGVISKTSTGLQLLIKDSVVNSIAVSVLIK